jgi:glycosyltransferase involved in cell wall biosynthesis
VQDCKTYLEDFAMEKAEGQIDRPAQKPRLSLCMIIRNEVKNLSDSLDSVASVVDEVVIADTGSTDGSLEVARQRAHRLILVPWQDDFAGARNAALDMASGDWILVLDADERLRPGSGKLLRQAISTPDLLACRLHLFNHLGGGKTNDDFLLRLFRRLPQLRYTGRIHEQIVPAVAYLLADQPGWRCINLPDVVIDHYGYTRDNKRSHDKLARNTRLLKLALAESPDDPYLCYKLSQELGADEEGSGYLIKAASLVMAMQRSDYSRLGYAAELITASALRCIENGTYGPALQMARFASDNFPAHPATLLALGLALLRSGNPLEARGEIERALNLAPPPGGFFYDQDELAVTARIALSSALGKEEKLEEALSLLHETRALYPGEERALAALMETLLATHSPLQALREGILWLRINPSPKILLLCADAAEMLGDKESAKNWRQKASGREE